MLEKIRYNLAKALAPRAGAMAQVRVEAVQTPNVPVYSEMTVAKATREGYKISIWVYRSVRIIIQAASAIPWIVVDDKTGEPIDGHELENVLRNPNPVFSGQDMDEFLIAHLLLVGNALWQPIIVGGKIKEIWPVMPDLVKPVPSDIRGEWLKGWSTIVDGRQTMLPPEQFVHFMQMDPGNPYWGISPLMAAARTIDTDNEAQDTQKISMQNRGVVDGVFTHEAPLTQEQFEEARRQVREKFLDKSRRREPWVLGAGAKWNQMSLTPVEMDFIASRMSNQRAIASAFGIDPWWLGDKSASTYNNVSEARKALYEDVIIPLLDDVRSTINLRMSPMYGNIHVTYDLSGVPALREDFGMKVTQAQSLWNMGVPFEQINDRLDMGFDEFPGWETGYMPMSLMPVGSSAPSEVEEEVEDPDEEPDKSRKIKILNIESEEAKSAYWKMIDRRRMGWWGAIFRKVKPMYKEEAKAITKAIKGKETSEEIEAAAARAIKEMGPKWEELMTAILVTLVEDFGKRTAEELGGHPKSIAPIETKLAFDAFSVASRSWISQHGAALVKTVAATNINDVRNVILSGKENDLTMPQIGRNISKYYSDNSSYKSMRVARTEVSAAAGFGQREAAKQSGVVKTKKWISSRDDRVRDSHQIMDGEERHLDEVYSNWLMYPGDPGGDSSESIQCRCVEQYLSREPEMPIEEEGMMTPNESDMLAPETEWSKWRDQFVETEGLPDQEVMRAHTSIGIGMNAMQNIKDGGLGFVLKAKGQVQGVMSYRVDGSSLWIRNLASSPWNMASSADPRKIEGVGRRMMSQIFREALAKGSSDVKLHAIEGARPFYGKVGFTPMKDFPAFMRIDRKGMEEFLRRVS